MKILIIDDDKDIADFLTLGLEGEAFAVDTAEDGLHGSYLARINDYDLVLLDYMLPKKHGFDVCKEIRSLGKTMPIIILSVQSTIENKVKLLNAGADDYLTKPFSFHELMARIRAVLRRPSSLAPDVLQVENLSLNTITQRVRRGEQEVYLTRKEFALLEFLLRHKGSVISRGMIMEHVWNAESDPFSNTIEAHVLNLRKKVDWIAPQRLIHTIPGRGYKIDSTL